MPRTTKTEYLQRHQDLRQLWLGFPETLVVLSPADQWRIHDYYQTQSTASDDQLLLKQDRLSREQPSLPQAAGKAYHQLDRHFRLASHYGRGDPLQFFRALMSLTTSEHGHLKRATRISLHPLVRPEPDIALLAQALISVAEAHHDTLQDDLDQAA